MKTLPLILFLLIGITLHAQYDSNGAPITNDDFPINNEAPYYEDTQTEFQDCIWEDVRPLDEINTSSADAYPWISPDGLRLYFTQRQGNEDFFMMASRTSIDSLFGNIDFLPVTQILDYSARSCWLTNDELEIFYSVSLSNNSQLYHAVRDSVGAAFSSPTLVQLSGIELDFYAGQSLTQDKSQLFLYANAGTKNVYIFNETETNNYSFSHALNFSPALYGQLTKNDLGYYVASGGNDLYSSYRNSVDSTFSSFAPLVGQINSSNIEGQPTFSENEDIMVFIRANDDFWTENDLYIAHGQCIPTNIEHTDPYEYGITIYPVPASEKLTIDAENEGIEQVNLYDVLGKHALTWSSKYPHNQVNIDTQALAKGVYFCQITLISGYTITRKIVVE